MAFRTRSQSVPGRSELSAAAPTHGVHRQVLLLHDLLQLAAHFAHLLQGLLVREVVSAPLGTWSKWHFLRRKSSEKLVR